MNFDFIVKALRRALATKIQDAAPYTAKELAGDELIDALKRANDITRGDVKRNSFIATINKSGKEDGAKTLQLYDGDNPIGLMVHAPDQSGIANRVVEGWMNFAPSTDNFPSRAVATMRELEDGPYRAVALPALVKYYRDKGFDVGQEGTMLFKHKGGLVSLRK
jgi:hypothetical protein